MARQNVGKPKFYIDLLQYWHAKGLVHGCGPYGHYYDSSTNELAPTGDTQYWWGNATSPSGANSAFDMIGLGDTSNPSIIDRYRGHTGGLHWAITFKTRMFLPSGADTKFYVGFFNHNFANLALDPTTDNQCNLSYYKTHIMNYIS